MHTLSNTVNYFNHVLLILNNVSFVEQKMSPVKIFVGNIAVGTPGREIRELFAQYGQVTECTVLGVGNYAFVVSNLTY